MQPIRKQLYLLLVSWEMILVNRYEPQVSLDDAFLALAKQYSELQSIYEFIDLPENISNIEKLNSSILRNYYANAIDHNLVDIKTVKYIVNKNIHANGINERAIEQYHKAEQYLQLQIQEPLSLNLFYKLHKILIVDLFQSNKEWNLFSGKQIGYPERLDVETELELDGLFEFMNSDSEFHPMVQSWMLHFRIMALPIFDELKPKVACLLQHFWLAKHQMDCFGLISIEHELYLNKNIYFQLCGSKDKKAAGFDDQVVFGLNMHQNQLLNGTVQKMPSLADLLAWVWLARCKAPS